MPAMLTAFASPNTYAVVKLMMQLCLRFISIYGPCLDVNKVSEMTDIEGITNESLG